MIWYRLGTIVFALGWVFFVLATTIDLLGAPSSLQLWAYRAAASELATGLMLRFINK